MNFDISLLNLRSAVSLVLLLLIPLSLWIGNEIGIVRHWLAWVFLLMVPLLLAWTIYLLLRSGRARDDARS